MEKEDKVKFMNQDFNEVENKIQKLNNLSIILGSMPIIIAAFLLGLLGLFTDIPIIQYCIIILTLIELIALPLISNVIAIKSLIMSKKININNNILYTAIFLMIIHYIIYGVIFYFINGLSKMYK